MNQQLKYIRSIIKKHDIPCWLDSGTLLGCKRDNELIPSDNDIDISIWESDADQLEPLIRSAVSRGYNVQHLIWHGQTYSWKLHSETHKRNIDISVYRSSGNFAWKPLKSITISNPYSPPDPRYFAKGIPRHLMYLIKVYQFQKDKFGGNIMSITTPPWSWFYTVQHTWWIPKCYFESLVVDQNWDLLVPEEWESYLEFRYGDWETPTDEWNFYSDDNAVRPLPPDELLNDING